MTPLQRENGLVLSLVEAMLGGISSNFRRVGLKVENDIVKLQFILAEESALDREEIEEWLFVLESLQSGPIEIDAEVRIHAGDLQDLDLSTRAVFARRESV